MTNPLVSIIVPVYNAQKGLSRCLESICSQTYQELEIIVLNDGSTDDSLAICEQFRAKDPRLVVVDKENEGVSRTRNAGLALARATISSLRTAMMFWTPITPRTLCRPPCSTARIW